MNRPSYEYRIGLDRLKNAFLFTFIGAILSIIPIVSIIGGILFLVALVFWILTWRSFGNTELKGANSYSSTWKFLIGGIIVSAAIFIVGFAIIVSEIIRFMISNLPSPGQPFNLNSLPGIQGFLYNVLILSLVLGAISTIIWIRNYLSVRTLGNEISQKGLITAANLLIVSYVVSFASGIGSLFYLERSFAVLSSVNPMMGIYSSFGVLAFKLSSGLVVFGIISIVTLVITIIASYIGYSSSKDAMSSYFSSQYSQPPPPPPAPTPSSGASQEQPYPRPRYCRSCGHMVAIPNSNFCSNCGSKL